MKHLVDRLSFRNFRNLRETVLSFGPDINIIYGDNGMGKTNIIEAIYLCSTGKSHRTHKNSALIAFGNETADIVLYKNNGDFCDKINISLKQNDRKGIAVNGVPLKKLGELFGKVKTVMFSPEDMGLINEGPGARRRFMDMELCQLSAVYCGCLENYFKVLKQRNNLLKNARSIEEIKETVFIWNSQLEKYGRKIIGFREEFIKNISVFAGKIYGRITGGRESLKVIYKPETTAEGLKDKLDRGLERDFYYKATQSGPHKDDIIFKIDDKDVRSFGSQGQKKSAVLALRLSEAEVIKEESGELPVLLLDDVMSELDRKRQEFILKNLENMQIILTCTGIDELISKDRLDSEKTKVFFVNNGKITVKSFKNVL